MTARALARQYPSIFAQPVLHAVEPDVFRLRYFAECMSCGFCADHCCVHGVDIDVETARRVRTLGSDFDATVGVDRSEWFGEEIFPDPEFPSGQHLRTRTRNGYCVFHNPAGRGCRIHAWCLANGLDYHLYKPMVSILFPLTFEQGCLMPSNEILDGSLACAKEGPALYDGARSELAYFFGDDLVGELDAIRREYL